MRIEMVFIGWGKGGESKMEERMGKGGKTERGKRGGGAGHSRSRSSSSSSGIHATRCACMTAQEMCLSVNVWHCISSSIGHY